MLLIMKYFLRYLTLQMSFSKFAIESAAVRSERVSFVGMVILLFVSAGISYRPTSPLTTRQTWNGLSSGRYQYVDDRSDSNYLIKHKEPIEKVMGDESSVASTTCIRQIVRQVVV